MENPLALYGGAGALAALLGLLGYRMLQGRKEEAPPPSTVGGKAGAQSVFGATGGQSVDTSASSIQTDFSHSGMTAIDADEGVDPVAEADVYMAYGRDAQAEEILLDALKNEPTRHAIHVKLLEIYAQRKSQKQFETLASELYAQTSGVGAEWEKAAAMGRKLDPANPLYGSKGSPDAPPPAAALGVGAAGAAAAVAAGVAGVAAAAETPQPFKDTWTMPGELKAAAGDGADGETTVAMPRAAIPADAAAGSFDLDLPRLEGSSDSKPAAEAEAAGLDFDLGLDFSAPPPSSPAMSQMVRTGVLEPGIAERSEAAAAFATEAAEAERANRDEAFAGTESMVARSIIDFDLGDAAESLPQTKPAAARPDVPVMDLERTDVAGTLIDFNLDEFDRIQALGRRGGDGPGTYRRRRQPAGFQFRAGGWQAGPIAGSGFGADPRSVQHQPGSSRRRGWCRCPFRRRGRRRESRSGNQARTGQSL